MWDLDAVLDAAGWAEAERVTVARASRLSVSPLAPQGVLALRLDAPLPSEQLRAALRRYPSQTRVQIVDDAGGNVATRALSVGELNDGEIAEAAALVIDPVQLHDVRDAVDGLRGVIDRLRDPDDGCPWDNAQTHLSLRPHLLEETYEALEAIADGDAAELCEELGDVLMQVVLHAKLAEQDGAFDLDDVAEGIRAKLIRRHPHVFGGESAESAAWVEGAWERLKAQERPSRESVLDGVPKTLPALARAQSVLGRAERNGFAKPSVAASDGDLGSRALELAWQARRDGVQAEDALRDALGAFEARFRAMESQVRSEGLQLADLDADDLQRRWNAVAAPIDNR